MTNRELIEFYKTRKEHYCETDKFMKKYRQQKGGYISVALKEGISVDKNLAEPNQKWHLLVSYFGNKIEKELDNKAKCYSYFRCPELLLWMAESVGYDVREAERVAEDCCEKKSRIEACKAIRNLIPWKDIEEHIMKN